MLPIEPKSELNASKADNTMFKSAHIVAKNPVLQFASKAGHMFMQHPFWLLVAASVGIHTVFCSSRPKSDQKIRNS